MILTFREMGIHVADYEGFSRQHRDALIINQACDFIMDKFFPSFSEDVAIPYPEQGQVDIPSQTVRVYTIPYPVH